MKIIVLIIILVYTSFSQFEKSFVEKNGLSAYGKEFLFSIPSPFFDSQNAIVELYFFSEYDCQVTCKADGFNTTVNLKAYQKTKIIVPLEKITVDVFDISQILNRNSSYHQEKAFQINSSNPIKVYLNYILESSNVGESTQIFPNDILGTEYLIQSYEGRPYLTGSLSPVATLTSIADNNEVLIVVGGNLNSSLMVFNQNYTFGDTIKLNLNKGDVVQLCNFKMNNSELSGTKIISSQKLNVISGHYCANIPVTINPCNYLIESNLPITSFGTKYYIPSITERHFAGKIRIYAIETGTRVFENGEEILSLSNSRPGLKGNSWAEIRLNNKSTTDKNSVITSNKPIGISYLNTGANEDNQDQMKTALANILPVDFYPKFTNVIIPNDVNNNNINKQKFILPGSNRRISNSIYYKRNNNNNWIRLNEYFSRSESFDNEYEYLDEFLENYEGQLYSKKGHNLFIYSYSNQPPNKTLLSSTTEGFWNINSRDNKSPVIKIFDSLRVDDEYYFNLVVEDSETGLYKFLLVEYDENDEKIILEKAYSNFITNLEIIENTIIPLEEKMYKIYVYDNANNSLKKDLGYLFIEKEVFIAKDSLVSSTEVLDFGHIEIGSKIEKMIEVTSHSNTITELTNVYINSEYYDLLDLIVFPVFLDTNEIVNFNIRYLPKIEYNQLEDVDKYGKVDFGQLIIETTLDRFHFDLIGKGGKSNIEVQFEQNLDSVLKNESKLLKYNNFSMANNGSYILNIFGFDKENISNKLGEKADINNVKFLGDLEIDDDFNFKNQIIIPENNKINFENSIEIIGDEEGFYEYNIPLISNAKLQNMENFINLQFLVYQDNSSINQIPDEYIFINNSEININLDAFSNSSNIKIIDVNGKMIFSEMPLFNNSKFDLTEYKNKVLIIIINDRGKIFFKKIIV